MANIFKNGYFNPASDPEASDIQYRKEMFYETGADTTVRLSDGETVRFSKSILCYNVRNDAFLQMFFGPLQTKMIEFTDLNSEEFKLFLNCMMGFEKLNKEKAIMIFPAVWKYQVEHLIELCSELLQPTEMDEHICDVLNLACFYGCEKLLNSAVEFVSRNYRYRILLENEKFCSLLWPDSIRKLLEFVEMDSYLALIILRWGDNAIRNNGMKNTTLRDLFKKYGILKKITPDIFESMVQLVKFLCSPLGKNFFTVNQIESFRTKCKNSEWRLMKKSGTLTEDFSLEKNFTTTDKVSKLDIFRNDLIICNEPGNGHLYYCTLSVTADGSKATLDQTVHFGDQVFNRFEAKHFAIEVVEGKPVKVLNLKVIWTFECDCRVLTKMDLSSDSKNLRFTDVKWSKNYEGDTFVKSIML